MVKRIDEEHRDARSEQTPDSLEHNIAQLMQSAYDPPRPPADARQRMLARLLVDHADATPAGKPEVSAPARRRLWPWALGLASAMALVAVTAVPSFWSKEDAQVSGDITAARAPATEQTVLASVNDTPEAEEDELDGAVEQEKRTSEKVLASGEEKVEELERVEDQKIVKGKLRLATVANKNAATTTSLVTSRNGLDAWTEGPLAIPTKPDVVTLPDGSRLYRDTGTELTVNGPRALSLTGGRVFFHIAHDPDQKFTVGTPDGQVGVLGTQFVVQSEGKLSRTTVVSGKVEVSNPAGTQTLGPGEEATMRAGAGPERVAAPATIRRLAWAKPLMATTAEEPVRSRHGQLYAKSPWNDHERALPMRRATVDVHVEHGMARVTLDTTFFNPSWARREGYYTFRVPADAAVSRLAMYVGDTLMEGGIVERDRARAVYESIVYRRRDPALLEWMAGGEQRVRIFPLEPWQEKRLLISWTQPVERLFGDDELRIPLPVVDGKAPEVTLRASIIGATDVTSPTHVTHSDTGGEVRWTGDGFGAHGAWVLRWTGLAGGSRLAVRAEDEDGHYGAARYEFTLDDSAPRPVSERAVVVLCDTSGSRDATSLLAQRAVVREWTSHLSRGSKLAVGSFDEVVRWWRPGWADASDASTLDTWLTERFADPQGRANWGSALTAAAERLKQAPPGLEPTLVVVADGEPTAGERDIATLAKQLEGIEVVTLSVGARSPALERLADESAGVASVLAPGENASWVAKDAWAALHAPRAVALKAVAFGEDGDVLADALVHLSTRAVTAGETVWVTARAEKPISRLELTGQVAGGQWRQMAPLNDASTAAWLPRGWARLRVGDLVATKAPPRDELKSLGMAHFLVTPETSLLVLESNADYRKYKVSRRARTRFAPYDAPKKSKVVYDPPTGTRAPVLPLGGTRVFRRFTSLWYSPPTYAYGRTGRLLGGGVAGSGGLLNLATVPTQPIPDAFDFDQDRSATDDWTVQMPKAGPVAATEEVSGLREKSKESIALGNTRGGPVGGADANLLFKSSGAKSQNVWTTSVTTGEFANRGGLRAGYFAPISMHWSADPRLADPTELAPAFFATPRDVALANAADQGQLISPSLPTPEMEAWTQAVRQAHGTRRYVHEDDGLTVDMVIRSDGTMWSERTFGSGLRERIVWTAGTWSTEYEELGVRLQQRFGPASALVSLQRLPMLMPSARGLILYFELVSVDDRTLVIRHRRTKEELTFTRDARHRLVRVSSNQEAGNDLQLTYEPDGLVVANGSKRTRFVVSSAEGATPPVLAGERVVLPLDRPERSLAADADREERIQAMAAALAEGRSADVLALFDRFGDDELTRGVITLSSRALATIGVPKQRDRAVRALPDGDPLAEFLTETWKLHHAKRPSFSAALLEHQGLLGALAQHIDVLRVMERDTTGKRSLDALKVVLDRRPASALTRVAFERVMGRWAWSRRPQAKALCESLTGDDVWAERAWLQLGQLRMNAGEYGPAAVAFQRAFDVRAAKGELGVVGSQWASALRYAQLGNRDLQLVSAVQLGRVRRFRSLGSVRSWLALQMALRSAGGTVGVTGMAEVERVIRSLELADADRLTLAQELLQLQRSGMAQELLAPLVAKGGSRALELALGLAQQAQDWPKAVALRTRLLDRLLDRGAGLEQVRGNYTVLIVRLLSLPSTPERQATLLNHLRQWRRLDPGGAALYKAWVDVLSARNADREDVIRVATTLADRSPGESATLAKSAGWLVEVGELDAALELLRDAAALERTNPTWLMQQARIHSARGAEAAANALYRDIVAGEWHERFRGLVNTARGHLKP